MSDRSLLRCGVESMHFLQFAGLTDFVRFVGDSDFEASWIDSTTGGKQGA